MKTLIASCMLFASMSAMGCATTTPRIDTTHLQDIARSAHPQQDTQAWFGAPADVTHDRRAQNGCSEVWHWDYVDRTIGETLSVRFDAQGHVCGQNFARWNRPPRRPEADEPTHTHTAHAHFSMR